MSLALERRAKNIRFTFHQAIPNPLTVSTRTPAGAARTVNAPVYYHDVWADPDRIRDPATAPDGAFAVITWLTGGAGHNSESLVQIDVYTRIGAHNDPKGDPFTVVGDDLADAICAVFGGADAEGRQRGWLPMYDFSDPANPALVGDGACLFVQDTSVAGAWGSPRGRIYMNDAVQQGFNRIVITFGVRLVTDALPGNTYMEF